MCVCVCVLCVCVSVTMHYENKRRVRWFGRTAREPEGQYCRYGSAKASIDARNDSLSFWLWLRLEAALSAVQRMHNEKKSRVNVNLKETVRPELQVWVGQGQRQHRREECQVKVLLVGARGHIKPGTTDAQRE